eukprot:CAMPEP_0184496564 /NCGR_PEP_ID=MMETSP0113_2-20130426/34271_1 /TAXON_ID=91329 /ORGANISM="Norrisiella sphaerica, Strain BC52" /LENGTH=429 /DNA_ID=CAMNT_0026883241 /DNA_START=84 /DNA_END=1373 /DNA_ORIENTATION=+
MAANVFQSGTQKRAYNIHECDAQAIMAKYGVPVAKGAPATSAEDAADVAKKLKSEGVNDFVVKAQVLAGGRGKGTFLDGFKGGVHLVSEIDEVRNMASNMLGQRLVTKQTGPEGKPCNKVFVTERLFLRKETYFAILMDRGSGGPMLVGSSEGGMDIEAVAAQTPELIHNVAIDITKGPEDDKLKDLATKMGFTHDDENAQAVEIMKNLYNLFDATDATLIEVNPLGQSHEGTVYCLDAKLNFDDNAAYRHEEIYALRDESQEDPREVAAEKQNLNYIGLDGNIGCLVNGAGLAMATMDVITLNGGSPANFLDLGGGASVDQVTAAFKILNDDSNVMAILVNIFGGIMRCDIIALGIIKAASELGLQKPIVIRLAGTQVEEAVKLIDESGLRMLTTDDLQEAAQRVVRVAEIQKLAKEAHLSVKFDLPI